MFCHFARYFEGMGDFSMRWNSDFIVMAGENAVMPFQVT